MPTKNQLLKNCRKKKKYKNCWKLFEKCPQKKGTIKKILRLNPRKPNSALRNIAKVQLINNKFTLFTKISGEGEGQKPSLQKFAHVLVKPGRSPDVPGTRGVLIRGKYDFSGLFVRLTSRSKYGLIQIRPLKKRFYKLFFLDKY